MASVLHFFMAQEDEVAFLRFLERFELELYPVRIPADYEPIPVNEDALEHLPEEDCYLAASKIGDVLVDKYKRGKDKGAWRVDEVRSPVIHYARSRQSEEGELLPGRLWAELSVTAQTGRQDPAPDRFRRLFTEIEEHLKKLYRKSEPKGFLVGPNAAREFKAGLVLRDSEHKGRLIRPFR